MKKVIIFLGIIIILFVSAAFITQMENKEKAKEGDNIYNKNDLHPETVAQMEDPNYQNIILPDQLEKKLENKENVTVYFYSPLCPHCAKTTPIVAPLAKEMGVDLYLFNLLEFESGWDDYNLESTPTIVQYKDGKETTRIVGYQEREVFEEWFNNNSK